MATTPPVYDFPVRRRDMLVGAQWNGNQGDAELELLVGYLDASGVQRSVALQAGGDYPPNGARALCLPVAQKNPAVIHRDVLVAHVRMAAYLARAVMGTREFTDAILGTGPENALNLQTALGAEVQVTGIQRLSETSYRLTFYCKNGSSVNVDVGHDEVSEYVFAPSTQMLTLAGHIKKVLGFVHDPPGTVLSQAQMDEIVACVVGTGAYADGGAKVANRWQPFI